MTAVFYEGNQHLRRGDSERLPPGPNEVRLNVAYCGICGTDLHIFHGKMDQRVTMPQIMGHELSATVAETGSHVTNFEIGQPVTVMPLDWCDDCPACRAGHTHICHNLKFLGIDTPGAFQSSWTVPARSVIPMPKTVDLQKGALIEPLAVACHDVRLGSVKAGDDVVIIGGGPIGALIAMVSRAVGARVTVSELNPYRIGLLKELGFDVINSAETDPVEAIMKKTIGKGADVVFEVTAHPAGIETALKLPRTRGRIVVVGIFADPPPVNLFNVFWKELQIIGVRVYEREDFKQAVRYVADETLPLAPLVTWIVPLKDLESGFRQLESGGNVMKMLIKIEGNK